MATIDLGEGNKFIITKTHEEIITMLEELRKLEEKYPPFEIKEIKLPESEEKDQLIDIEQKTVEPKKTKKRIRIKRKQKRQPETTFTDITDDGPEFLELEPTQEEQDIVEITKEPQQPVYENLVEWEEIKPEQTIQTEVQTPDIKPEHIMSINETEAEAPEIESNMNLPEDEKNLEVTEIKKHRERIVPSTNIKLVIDEEGKLVLADKPKNITKKKVKTETKKEEKTKKSRLKNILPHRKKTE
ncbi:MAG: hypothetical protein QHH19_00550 [Candidatus Thermoplasmatota archaeon]|jgi:hypothetical protein|nr:hypothetical protein [Candidatus Thermoplasmatota archaeon]